MEIRMKAGSKIFLKLIIFLPIVTTAAINHNQIGYYPDAVKIAIVSAAANDGFEVINAISGELVYSGILSETREWDASAETVRCADFSEVKTPGKYFLRAAGCPDSNPFLIDGMVHNAVAKASVKAFYYNRCSYTLTGEYAGKWARGAGHPDTAVLIHNSAQSTSRPAGTRINASGGWYDAGDYGKYIVNSSISIFTLFAAYELFPDFYDTLNLDIPESGNTIPDVLDEALYNLRWMLKMQDPEDGGVYHKLTNPFFSGMIMPEEDTLPRYIVSKSTAAALDFAAICAHAARIFRTFSDPLPGFADSCLDASQHAWQWARENPSVFYSNSNTESPEITTGAYGDWRVSDEFSWAATELYITTKQDSFFTIAFPEDTLDGVSRLPSWSSVGTLALYSLFLCKEELSAISREEVIAAFDDLAGSVIEGSNEHPYLITMERSDFSWGSNSVAANRGMALVLGFLATGKETYRAGALHHLDYLLGRNPTGYSFVTGHGDKTPMFIHHRPSGADTVDEPVPGFLVGGPNRRQEDLLPVDCDFYPSTLPALSYVDHACSYASNEVAINWNAPLVFLTGAVEALFGDSVSMTVTYQKRQRRLSPAVRLHRGGLNVLLPHGVRAIVTIVNLQGKVLYHEGGMDDMRIVTDWPKQIVFIRTETNGISGKKTAVVRMLTGR